MRFGYHRLRAAAFAALIALFIASTGAPAPVSAATRADSVIAVAKTKLGAHWVQNAVGPRVFDCSGFVYYVFRNTGNVSRIGGRQSAVGYLAWFRHRGLASTGAGQPGDLVVWGGGSHVGIYLGHGMAISTLTNGIHIHGVHAVTARFTAFLHTGMSARAAQLLGATGTTAKPVVPVVPPPPAVPAAPVAIPAVTPAPTPVVTASAAAIVPAPTVSPAIDSGATATTPSAAPTVDSATTTPVVVAGGTGTPSVVPSTAALPKSANTRRTTVNLNLRSGPGTGTHRIRVLRPGMRITILRSRPDSLGRLWYKVRLNSGQIGWVASWYTR